MKTISIKETINSLLLFSLFSTFVGLGIWMNYLSPNSTPKPDFEILYPREWNEVKK